MLSDGPKCSETGICADDVGSVLKKLEHIKTQYSIFRLAQQCAGMVLKPSKCFLVISYVELTLDIVASVKSWLACNVPEWRDFQLASTGKYLGVWLGLDSAACSWKAPIDKFGVRILEVFDGKAPALLSILQYNERVLPVFSYVSQVFLPPESINGLEQ